MEALLTRAGCFVAIMALGFVLRRVGFFKEGDFSLLSKISLRITLPAAIITGFSDKQIDASLLTVVLLGLAGNVAYMLAALLLNLRSSKNRRAFDLLNLSGYNVGAFTVPFLSAFLGPGAVVVGSIFDIGNAMIGLGTSYGIASAIKEGKRFSFKRMGKALITSVPLVTYVIMTVLTLVGIRLPKAVQECAGLVGSANTFVAMLMIGVGFRLSADLKQLGVLVRLLVTRYAVAAVLAAAAWYLLPFDMEVRKTLVLLLFAPAITASPAYTAELREDVGISSAFNSLTILISLVVFVVLLSVMGTA